MGLTSEERRGDDGLDRVCEVMEAARKVAIKQALYEAELVDFPTVEIPDGLDHLGVTVSSTFSRLIDQIDRPSERVQRVQKQFWIAERFNKLAWDGWISGGAFDDNELTRSYGESFGADYGNNAAYAFSEFLSENSVVRYLPDIDKEYWYAPLLPLAALWLIEAERLAGCNRMSEALNKVADALSAHEDHSGYFMWDEGYKCHTEDAGDPPSAAAILAKKRHEKTMLNREAVAVACKDFPRTMSANNVATALLMQGKTPFSHKKTAEIISEAKKKKPD